MTTTLLNKVMTLELAKELGQLLGSEQLNEQEKRQYELSDRMYKVLYPNGKPNYKLTTEQFMQLLFIQDELSMNQVLHITDGGAVYLATSHDLRESSDTTRLN